jgi:hypothetical protein
MIHVCSLARLHETVEETGALHVVTLLKDTDRVERPRTIVEANHLILGMDDIAVPMDGYVIPCDEHVTRLIEFVRGWHRTTPMVVHCYAGISRSTAGAFVAARAQPDRSDVARGFAAPPRRRPPIRASWRSPTACWAATAAWSPPSTRSAAARWPTRASRSGLIWNSSVGATSLF